eukprot:246255-Prymnesium_polylepis.1
MLTTPPSTVSPSTPQTERFRKDSYIKGPPRERCKEEGCAAKELRIDIYLKSPPRERLRRDLPRAAELCEDTSEDRCTLLCSACIRF